MKLNRLFPLSLRDLAQRFGWNRTALPLPIRVRRAQRPRFRPLEARFVLNASAELNELGQLLVFGTSTADTINLEVNVDGEMTLRNELNEIIPIGGPGGVGTAPLPQQSVTSNQIIFFLGDGDDTLNAELPSSLDVTLQSSEGVDSAFLTLTDRGPQRQASYRIDAETITLNQNASSVRLVDDQLLLHGDVYVGTPGLDSTIDLGSGDLSVEGRFILLGDVDMLGNGGRALLADAVTTSTSPGTSLRFLLGDGPDANLSFGGADDSGGSRLLTLDVGSATDVSFLNQPTQLDGDLLIRSDTGTITIDTSIVADEVVLLANDEVTFQGDTIDATQLVVGSGGRVEIDGVLTIGQTVQISASGGDVDLSQSTLHSAFNGDVLLISDANAVTLGIVDAANGQITLGTSQDISGQIDQSPGTSIDVDRLNVSSANAVDLSSHGNKIGSVGTIVAQGAVDLFDLEDGLAIGSIVSGGGEVSIETSGSDGDVLVGQSILSEGGRVQVVASRDIVMEDGSIIDGTNGSLSLEAQRDITVAALRTLSASDNAVVINAISGGVIDGGDADTDIDANFGKTTIQSRLGIGVGNALETRLDRIVAGVASTGSIELVESDSITLEQLYTDDGKIDVVASGTIFANVVQSANTQSIDSRDIELTTLAGGDIVLGQITASNSADILLDADDDILGQSGASIVADEVVLLANDEVTFQGDTIDATQLVVGSGGRVEIDGVLTIGQTVQITASGGDVDLSQSTLHSAFNGDVLLISDANAVTLGIVDAANGQITLGTSQDISGQIDQSPGTSIDVDRLNVSSANAVDLSASGNKIGSVGTIVAQGAVDLFDLEGGLMVGSIVSGGGEVSIETSGSDGDLLVGQSILSEGGRVQVVASRDIVMEDGSLIDGTNGSLSLEAQRDITVAALRTLSASDNAVVINAISGRVIDGGDADTDIDANFGKTTIESQTGIGVGNALETRLDRIVAGVASTGSIELVESDSITLEQLYTDDGKIEVLASGTIFAAVVQSVNSQSIDSRDIELTTLAGGDIVLGQITASNSADVLFDADDDILGQSGASIIADEVVLLATNEVTFQGDTIDATQLVIDAGGRVEIDGVLTIGQTVQISASGGDVDLSQSSLHSDFDGDVLLISDANAVTLGIVDAANGQITLGTSQDISGQIDQSPGTSIDVDRLNVSSANAVDLSSPGNKIGSVGTIVAQGAVDLFDLEGGLMIGSIVSGGGEVSIETSGSDGDVLVGQSILSEGGRVQVVASRDIVMEDGSIIDGTNGTLSLEAQRDITVAALRTLSASDNAVVINAISGRVIDGGDADTDIDANFGKTTIESQTGIGVGNALETRLDRIVAGVASTGSIELVESDSITLEQLYTDDGKIEVLASGTIFAAVVQSVNSQSIDSRDIELTTLAGGDIVLGQITASNSADILLDADDDIFGQSDSFVVADDLKLISQNRVSDGEVAIDLNTEVESLTAVVTGDHRGDIVIHERGSVELASDDSGRNDLVVQTSNGEIRVDATQDIVISDQRDQANNVDFAVTPKVIAGGDHGRIQLDAGNGETDQLRLGNGVAIVASQSTLGAVQLDGANVVLGEQVEIRTGGDVGVARVFSPRPQAGLAATAFFDSTTVTTNRLEQANENDGRGVLSVEVGQSGERGLTLNIDWGAETGRYQQEDLIVGGEVFAVDHVYTEQDILDSRLNGRPSATAPLEVRFSMRHHESIVVTGDTVQQGVLNPIPTAEEALLAVRPGETESVPSGVVSATDNDNPLRPDLPVVFETNTVDDNATLDHRNGNAQFIIPSLSIPVAFFPVRDVIPEPETLEVFVKAETVIAPRGTSVEATEASVTSLVGREEYLQIRILSPDPNGEDLAPPERLPDSMLEGDKLKRLFSRLPDGRYAIEYVLGDGNERTIIEVDIRDGEPVATGDEMEGGFLELKLLDELPNEDPVDRSNDAEKTSPDNKEKAGDELPPNGLDRRLSRAARFAQRMNQND
ncbi:beta strand repeat-containing protein [Novipirellula artificiosorum]|uniref:Uncharacterized protein n=1 Tax=Novipirellula artificiosorum TaxID=2528016 RepID=A0A5C6DGV1_9BACT|nr:hypothetical protein [Novipirellula artificiosorum]TWU34961.1 hypothetical protein Poly41_41050 [Novipirellula artificiosorum]